MVEAELIVNSVTLVIVAVVLLFVGVAYYRTRLTGLLIVLLLATLVGANMIVATAEDLLARRFPHLELFSSLLALGTALLLLATVIRRFSWKSQ